MGNAVFTTILCFKNETESLLWDTFFPICGTTDFIDGSTRMTQQNTHKNPRMMVTQSSVFYVLLNRDTLPTVTSDLIPQPGDTHSNTKYFHKPDLAKKKQKNPNI